MKGMQVGGSSACAGVCGRGFKKFFAAFVAMLALGLSAAVITIPENGTLTIGGTAADPYNQRANYIVFEPGSTLVVTSINASLSIWSTLIATNGAATVRLGEADKSKGPTFQYNVFINGEGSLTLRDMATGAIFGHADHYPVVDLGNLYKGEGVGTVTLAHGLSALQFPTNVSWLFTADATKTIRLFGRNMFPDDDVIGLDRCKIMLCNPEAIPAGKTVHVTGDRFLIAPLKVLDPADGIVDRFGGLGANTSLATGCVYNCNVELVNNSTMTFTNSVAVAFNGSISGYNSKCGNIALSGYRGVSAPVTLGGDNSGFTGTIAATIDGTELVLSNANAAVNANIDMTNPIVVRGADGIPAVSIGAVSGGTDLDSCIIRAASNQTVSVAKVSGIVHVCGGGAGSGSTIEIGTLEPGAVVYDDKTAMVTYGGSSSPPRGTVRGQLTSSAAEIIAMQRNKDYFDAADNVYSHIPAFDLQDGMRVTCGTNAVTARVGSGVEAKILPADGEVFSVAGAGSFAVESLLLNTVGWWFDFSRADTIFRIGEGATEQYLDQKFNDQQLIERVVDWRYPDAACSLWNRRLYLSGGGFECAPTVYPYIPASTQNGLQYISMYTAGSSRRLPFSDGTGSNSKYYCSAQLVVMAFGLFDSQTGGSAMIGTEEGAFGRTSTSSTAGMTTNTTHDVWQNGVKVDPTTTRFKSGFQVISVALDGLLFNGLGFLKNMNGDRGGQSYGEVLIFTNAVSTQLRLEAEYYLARKWGLESQYSSAAVAQLKELRNANPVRIATVGGDATTIKAGEQTVSVEGRFAGTVNLDGGTLVVPDRPLPYTEGDIPSAGRLYWADPDDAETVLHLDDPAFSGSAAGACSNEVRAVLDKSVRTLESTVGRPLLFGLSFRRPTPILQSRGLGPERTWLDFNDYADTIGDGNCLRCIVCPELSTASFKSGTYNTLAAMNVRTAFIVQDSVRGGGTPFMGDVNGANPPYRRIRGTWSQTIWVNDLPAAFANGENRLNGKVVDYAKGFQGQPEVFTVRGTDTVNLPVIGSYHNSEKGEAKGEIIGEILLYSTALNDDAVKGIESYLMDKWIGRLPEGYADIRQATVAGTGTVQVAVGAQRPSFDREFEGTVSIASGGDFSMTVDTETGKVMGAFDCPAATLSLPASCSITVNFTRKPTSSMPTRDYVLVDCASGASGVAWTLNRGTNAPSRGLFQTTGNKIVFKYLQPGMSISFR